MDAVKHEGAPLPELSQASVPRCFSVEREYTRVRDFLIAMNQQAGGSGTGAAPAFAPGGAIRLLLDACTGLGSEVGNAKANECADRVRQELSISRRCEMEDGKPVTSMGLFAGIGGKDLRLEENLEKAVNFLIAAAHAGIAAPDTIDAVVKLLLPHISTKIHPLTGRFYPTTPE